jgi:hypothetical protein
MLEPDDDPDEPPLDGACCIEPDPDEEPEGCDAPLLLLLELGIEDEPLDSGAFCVCLHPAHANAKAMVIRTGYFMCNSFPWRIQEINHVSGSVSTRSSIAV